MVGTVRDGEQSGAVGSLCGPCDSPLAACPLLRGELAHQQGPWPLFTDREAPRESHTQSPQARELELGANCSLGSDAQGFQHTVMRAPPPAPAAVARSRVTAEHSECGRSKLGRAVSESHWLSRPGAKASFETLH